jgi:hypothetical protein
MAHKKPNLSEKQCIRSGPPFAWRKKWGRDWEHANIARIVVDWPQPQRAEQTAGNTLA